ncbi:exonuclease mut-7 homolog isoform X1 [Colletes gigas]|uniref:exonuclease mut-7 homolog isoform X1 n=1 Tax=Colletes gigas TaxID=935657 RepID=UPI001C9B7B08|nr:exonuclease mut-7 homolog isoform X1 [Colletes gigas]
MSSSTVAELSTNNDNDYLLFFSSIDEATKEWLKSLANIWQLCKHCEGLSKTLIDYFESAPNPYLSTIRIIVNTTNFKQMKSKSTLAFAVIEEYAKWLEPRKEELKHFLVPDLKLATFQLIISQSNMQFIKLVADTYDFVDHKEEFLNIIEKMIEDKKYKEAAQYAVMLKLQSFFQDIESLLLPLILQNRLTNVQEFIHDYPQMQIDLVQYLDNLIAPDNNMHNQLTTIIQERNIPDVKISTTQKKPMIKLISRFIKLYNLPPDFCQNLNKKRSKGALHFLMYKRYTDGSLNTASWKEMIEEAVGDDRQLQLDMIKMLINANDNKEGLYWARKLNIPKEQWPWAISYEADHIEIEGINEGASTSRGEMSDWEDSDDSINYHELKLSRDCIKVVNNVQSFEDFLNNGLRDVRIVGIDSEWKPNFGTKQTELALIQIATKTNVYILDVTTMGSKMKLWAELAMTLFENKSILKLGFGIAHDMTVMHDSLPALANVKTYGEGYLDVVQLWKKLVDEYKFVFPHEGDEHLNKKSLSKLVELCFGQKLDKSDQFSNWEQRPLRNSQIMYAALDAYCLLEIYSVLENQCKQLDIQFHEICAEIQHIPHRSPKKNIKKPINKPCTSKNKILNSDRRQNIQTHGPPQRSETMDNTYDKNAIQEYRPQRHNQKQTEAHKWRVVCDSMLGPLASVLRTCGCDCVFIPFDPAGSQSLRVALCENRILLTRRTYFSQSHPPLGKSYLVLTDTPNEQLREVLNHFKVLVTRRNIYSRCKVCNSNEFAKVPKLLMDKLAQSFAKLSRKYKSYPISDASITNSVNDYKHSEDRTWTLSTNSVNINKCSTKYNMCIQIDKVPVSILKSVQLFYICERCGKVYWDGTKLERTLYRFKDLVRG